MESKLKKVDLILVLRLLCNMYKILSYDNKDNT